MMILPLIFLLSIASSFAFPVIGSMDGLTFSTDFGAWWIAEGNTFNLLLNDYSDWYTVAVTAVDANGCTIGAAEGSNVVASAITTEYVPLNTIIEIAGTQLGVYQVDLTPPTIRCRIAYNFVSLGPVSSVTESEEESEEVNNTEETENNEEVDNEDVDNDEIMQEIAICTEEDNGKAPHEASEAITTFTNGGSAPHPDTCLDQNTLREYYCTGRDGQGNQNDYAYQDYNCPSGCADGACVHEICQDTDGGIKKYIAGTMTHDFADIPSPVKDYCYSENTKVKEYFCASGLNPANPEAHNSYAYTCFFGCITEKTGGRCRKASDLWRPQIMTDVFGFWLGNNDEEPVAEGYQWTLDTNAQDVLEEPLIRAWDQGDFETDLRCPDGYLVSTMEVESERYLFVPQIYGITLHCARAGGEHLLNLADTATRSWQFVSNNGGFTAYRDSIITGLRGYYRQTGLNFIKIIDARQTQYHYNDEVDYAVGGTELWQDVPQSYAMTSTGNVVAYCGSSDATSQRTSVSGLSGIRIYSTERGNKEIVSALQPRCSTLERVAAN